MIAKILKIFGKSVKKTTESVGKSMEFIDDVLDKEYITSTVDNLKETSGKVVEKAGENFQKTKDMIEENVDMDSIRKSLDKAIEKGKEYTGVISENLMEKSKSLKNVMKEGEEVFRELFEEE